MDQIDHCINAYSDKISELQNDIRTHIRQRNHVMHTIQSIMDTTTDKNTFLELEKLLMDDDTSSDEDMEEMEDMEEED